MARHWRRLAVLLLAAACSGDATVPDPASADPEPQPPAPPANRAPTVAGEIPAQTPSGAGGGGAVGAYFTDPRVVSRSFVQQALRKSLTSLELPRYDGNLSIG